MWIQKNFFVGLFATILVMSLLSCPAFADVWILPGSDIAPYRPPGVGNSTPASVSITLPPNTSLEGMAFTAAIPDVGTGQLEEILDATYTWSLAPTTPNFEFINPSGGTTNDTTFLWVWQQPGGTTRQFTLSCRVQGYLGNGAPFDQTGTIGISVKWANVNVNSITVTPVEGPNFANMLSMYAGLQFNITVHGQNLSQAQHRQLISQIALQDGYNGQLLLGNDEKVSIPNLATGQPAPGHEFVDAVDWTWSSFNNNNQVYTLPDNHGGGAGYADLTFEGNELAWGYTYLTTITQTMKFQVKVAGAPDDQLIAEHYWGYTWDNWNGKWSAGENPAPPVQSSSGGPVHWPDMGGEFTAPIGLSGALPDSTFHKP